MSNRVLPNWAIWHACTRTRALTVPPPYPTPYLNRTYWKFYRVIWGVEYTLRFSCEAFCSGIVQSTEFLPNRAKLREKTRQEWGERDGERAEHQVFLYLDRHLGPEWEIFSNPVIGQGRPDFVVVSRTHGVIIVEVKSWNLERVQVQNLPRGIPNLCLNG